MTHLNTVGLYGATGNLGEHTLKYLLGAHRASKLKLVVIARPTAKIGTDVEEAGAEVRRVDVESEGDLASAVEGIEYFISTVGPAGIPSESRLLDALIRSPTFVTATPAVYGRPWTSADYEALPELKEMDEELLYASRKLKEGGKGFTDVWAGVFHREFLVEGVLGLNVRKNTIQLNEGMRKNEMPMTTLDYLGFALAWLASQPLASIADRQYTFISHRVTGDDLSSALRAVHGAEPTIKPMGTEEIQKWREEGAWKPLEALMITAWRDGRESGSYKNETKPQEVGYEGIKTLEEEVRAVRDA